VSVREKIGVHVRENRTYDTIVRCEENWDSKGVHTWVAIYVREGLVTEVIPWILALPERVALTSLSTELGDVKMCL
jgi:hypothetical protein